LGIPIPNPYAPEKSKTLWRPFAEGQQTDTPFCQPTVSTWNDGEVAQRSTQNRPPFPCDVVDP